MSYNGFPEWTKEIALPQIDLMKCPSCGVVSEGSDEVFSTITGNPKSYYHPRHIPPRLLFTCFNEGCPDCDLDYYVELSCTVVASTPQLAE